LDGYLLLYGLSASQRLIYYLARSPLSVIDAPLGDKLISEITQDDAGEEKDDVVDRGVYLNTPPSILKEGSRSPPLGSILF
jgi:hypothetical protein